MLALLENTDASYKMRVMYCYQENKWRGRKRVGKSFSGTPVITGSLHVTCTFRRREEDGSEHYKIVLHGWIRVKLFRVTSMLPNTIVQWDVLNLPICALMLYFIQNRD